MPKLSEQAQESRRAHILEAAEACFARAGFHRTTMQDICREAGVSPGALYLYFASKEALIEGIAERDRKEVLAEFAVAAGKASLIDGLAEVLRACVIDAPAHRPALLMEMGAEATRNPAVSRTVLACDGAIRGQLEAVLGEAIARGEIAPVVPAATIAALMAVVADGLFWRRAVDPSFDCAALGPHITGMFGSLLNPHAGVAPALAPPTMADA
ncbi:MAG: TetR/AcrR family transcriptional regulator [Methylobacteriaceae bacterium]|nr:TetR/AcrR family transcriptional regulator [Methylobacteriaceae bacterium]